MDTSKTRIRFYILLLQATQGAHRQFFPICLLSTKTGIPYLSKYPDQFTNVAIRPVSSPLVMYKFFGAVNEVDSNKKIRLSDLALDKFWVDQCGWLQVCTTVAMGITITNCWKLFFCGVKRDFYEKFIGIREF